MITSKDLTIVAREEFDGRLCGIGRYTVELVYYFPNNKELHGKTIPSTQVPNSGGTFICNKGEKEIWLSTNNVCDRKLRSLLPTIKGAKLISSDVVADYKDDPNGNRIWCGAISCQKWDVSGILSNIDNNV